MFKKTRVGRRFCIFLPNSRDKDNVGPVAHRGQPSEQPEVWSLASVDLFKCHFPLPIPHRTSY